MSDLRTDLEALINRAMADGGAVIPIDVLRDLLEHGPRPAPSNHEIVSPGISHAWLIRHPADCTDLRCRLAEVARRQFPAPEFAFTPGAYAVRLFRDHTIIQIGQSA